MQLKIHGIYKHFKGDYYLVEGVATHSETGEKLVVYRPLYGETADLYVRPLSMFLEPVEGKSQAHRFELQNIESKNPR